MSWGAYVTSLEQSAAHVQYAGLHGISGGLWAESTCAEFKPTPEEVANAVRILQQEDQNVFGNGFMMGGARFTCLRLEPDVIVLQGKDKDKKEYSLVICLSGKAAIIGMNLNSEVKAATVRTAVEGMKDYLKGQGY